MGNYTVNMYGVTDDDYALFNVAKEVLPEADGWQTATYMSNPSTYEWWYFDITNDDGSVITGAISPYPNDGFVPSNNMDSGFLKFSYEKEGITRTETVTFPFTEFSAATDSLDVQAGPVTMRGDLETMTIVGNVNGIELNVVFKQQAMPFRPGNGYVLIGSDSLERWRGWFNAYPKAAVTGTLTLDGGEPQQVNGSGYHDHNYGTVTAAEATVGWLWARAVCGKYCILTVRQKYRQKFEGDIVNRVLWIYDLEKGEEIVRSIDGNGISVCEGIFKQHPDPLHGGGYPTQTLYQYWVGDNKAEVILSDFAVLDGYFPYDIHDAAAQRFLSENSVNGLYYTRRNTTVSLKLDMPELNITDNAEGTALHELQESYFPQYSFDK